MRNIQKIIIYIVLQFLYRGMKVLYKDDQRISKYLKGLSKVKNKNADIEITFKSISTAFKVFTGMMSVKQAYLQHCFILKGDIYESMRFVRCVDLVETYLFPYFMTKRILNHYQKRYQPMLIVYIKTLFV